jgi:hypothetical protein
MRITKTAMVRRRVMSWDQTIGCIFLFFIVEKRKIKNIFLENIF